MAKPYHSRTARARFYRQKKMQRRLGRLRGECETNIKWLASSYVVLGKNPQGDPTARYVSERYFTPT